MDRHKRRTPEITRDPCYLHDPADFTKRAEHPEDKARVIEFKLGLALAIFAAGALGGALPILRPADRGRARWTDLGNAFAAGVFLGAGLMHLLPEGSEHFRDLGFEYPMAYAMAALAFVLMLFIEHVVLPEPAHEIVHAPSSERFAHLPHGESGLTAYAVLIALSAHSVLAGLALGAEPEFAGALLLSAAILVHKSLGGFALGVSLARDRMPTRRAWTLLGLFSIATPLGIAVGVAVGQSSGATSHGVFEATALSLAAGTFVYVATLDILREEFVHGSGRLEKWSVVVAGTALMATLAVWV